MSSRSNTLLHGIVGWFFALVMFFPVLWMGLTAFKTEIQAISMPPLIIFEPTLDNFREILTQSDYLKALTNSVLISFGSTVLCLLLAAPAAYSFAFYPTRKTKDLLVWILSNKMMPAAGALVPIYLIYKFIGLIDSVWGLVILYMCANLPIAIWMLFSFFKEVPREILEASQLDGANPAQQFWHILLPATVPGIASCALLSIILTWNDAFWSINLTTTEAGPLSSFISSFANPQGLFWAKLCAASLLGIGPVLIIGWLTQKQIVRGLTFGAVK